MNVWTLVIAVAVILAIWLIAKRYYFDPAEREQSAGLKEAMMKQAQKRDGRVELGGQQPMLHVPTKHGAIQLSLLISPDETFREHTYARFRVEQFANKDFAVLLRSDNILLKPLAIGTRVELADEQFGELFLITGNDPEFVAEVLNTEIRDKLRESLLQLSLGRRTDSSLLDRERGWLSVHTQFPKTGDEIFDSLIETAILIQARFASLSA